MDQDPTVLPLAVDEVPEITDALVVVTVHMRAQLEADRERAALHDDLAVATDKRDWKRVAALHRRLAQMTPVAARMARIAAASAAVYDVPGGAPSLPQAGMDARVRRALLKITPWMTKRWWPLYGSADAPRAAARALQASTDSRTCRKRIRDRFRLWDDELLRLAADARPEAMAARRLMVHDRNARAAACRECGGCKMSTDPLTDPLPLP